MTTRITLLRDVPGGPTGTLRKGDTVTVADDFAQLLIERGDAYEYDAPQRVDARWSDSTGTALVDPQGRARHIPLRFAAAGRLASPVATFDGASASGTFGLPEPILIPANFLRSGTGLIKIKVRIQRSGTETGSFFQLHFGPLNSVSDPNIMASFGGVQYNNAANPYDATFEILISYKTGAFSISHTRQVPNVGTGIGQGEFTGTYDNTVDNYLNFVTSSATASNTYRLLAYEVEVFP